MDFPYTPSGLNDMMFLSCSGSSHEKKYLIYSQKIKEQENNFEGVLCSTAQDGFFSWGVTSSKKCNHGRPCLSTSTSKRGYWISAKFAKNTPLFCQFCSISLILDPKRGYLPAWCPKCAPFSRGFLVVHDYTVAYMSTSPGFFLDILNTQ